MEEKIDEIVYGIANLSKRDIVALRDHCKDRSEDFERDYIVRPIYRKFSQILGIIIRTY